VGEGCSDPVGGGGGTFREWWLVCGVDGGGVVWGGLRGGGGEGVGGRGQPKGVSRSIISLLLILGCRVFF